MANSRKIKIKLLKLYDILKTETDKNHPLSTYELVEKLKAQDMTCDRRTLSKDIEALNDLGLSIRTTKAGHQKAYYVDNCTFSIPELKVLIDAVQAASFISEKKAAELIDKLSALGGTYRQEVLKGNQVTFNTRKHTNESVLKNVELINAAINEHKKISFYYFDLNENHERVYRKNGKRYKENPAALVYNEDNYYLVCYSDKYKKQLNYRVDRMDAIMKLNENIPKESYALVAALPKYTRQVFKMFSGEAEIVTLHLDRSILGQIYDKFGEETEIKVVSEQILEITAPVQVSPTFLGWLFQFGNKLTVVHPECLRKSIAETLEETGQLYK